MIELVGLETVDAGSVERLLDRAFGPDRHGRTAYRIRLGTAALPGLSLAALDAGVLIGSIQCWPVALTPPEGRPVPLVMVGPVAVDPTRQRDGIGRRLMEASLAATGATGDAERLMLIGDAEYYARFFGFTAERTARWQVPGPVERHRLLARGTSVPDIAGMLGPRLAVPA